ncbi:MAG: ABC transporter permease subunit [Alphaproteobacteria bacterium]|nr:ABC transporter permease subunit [Alphaproteobacteria bacterium]
MNGLFANEWTTFPDRYAGHILLSLSALGVGLVLSVPLGVLASRSPRVAGAALGFASIVQTIPGLALLALMVPLLGGQIGFWPAFAALTLYSILPILRNTIVGLRGVDPDVREAALAVGMTGRQRLFGVDLPLAAPVIVAGLRTASVWVVGAATLATPVGAHSLGGYIFQGLQTRNWGSVIFGCIASAALALALDQIIALFEKAALRRSLKFVIVGAAGFLLIFAPLLAGPYMAHARAAQTSAAAGNAGPLSGRTIVVGAKTFTEQYILANVIRRVLESQGAQVDVRQGLGSTVAFDALAHDQIDLYVDYSGTVWATNMKREDAKPRDDLYSEMSDWLLSKHGILAADRLGFENAYAFATSRKTAKRLGLKSIADLAGKPVRLGSDPEFFGRSEWTRTRDAYGLQSLRTQGMDSTFMYDAVKSGRMDVITAYTTDGRIDAYNFILLDDPKSVLPPYDAFILIAPKDRQDEALLAALKLLNGAIDNAMMRRANAMVDLDRRSVADAGAWLMSRIRSNSRRFSLDFSFARSSSKAKLLSLSGIQKLRTRCRRVPQLGFDRSGAADLDR